MVTIMREFSGLAFFPITLVFVMVFDRGILSPFVCAVYELSAALCLPTKRRIPIINLEIICCLLTMPLYLLPLPRVSNSY